MTSLVLAEVHGASPQRSDAKAVAAATALGAPVHVLVAGEGVGAAAEAAAKIAGVEKVLVADDALYAHQLAEPLAALIVSLAGPYDAILAPSTTTAKNVMPRVAALLDVMQISDISAVVSRRHVRAPDLCRQRDPDGAVEGREEGHHRAHGVLQGRAARAASAHGRKCECSGRSGAVDVQIREPREVRPPGTGAAQRSSCRAVVRCRTPRTSRNTSSRWQTVSAPRWAPRAPRSMRATRRTTGRSARPARSWRPTSMSRLAFRALSSIWRA